MPKYKLVITDATLAHEKELERNTNAGVARSVAAAQQQRRRVTEFDVAALTRSHRREMEQRFKKRPAGTVHDVAQSECPMELPNCRNCGDPAHADACRAAGHCPDCGTKHGIAPSRIVAESGYALVEVTAEEDAAMQAEAARTMEERTAAADADVLARAIETAVADGRLTQREADAIKGRRP